MDDLEKTVNFLKILADNTRLKIVKTLIERKNPICVNALSHELNMSQSAISQHLRILKHTELVIGIKRGYFVHYEINKEVLNQMKKLFSEVLKTE